MAQSALKSGVRLADKALNFVNPGERIRPLRDQIIVKPLPLSLSERLRADWHGEVVRGVVIAAGPGCYPNIHQKGFKDGKPYHTVRQSKVFRPTEVKVGDVVELGGMEIGGYLWPKVWAEGDWCVICSEQDVAVLHECETQTDSQNGSHEVQARAGAYASPRWVSKSLADFVPLRTRG